MENRIEGTKEHIDWLRNAIKTFYPAFFLPPEEAIKQGIPTFYEGYKKSEILDHIFFITNTEDISEALMVLDYWLELLEYPESDMPAFDILQNEIDPVIDEVKKMSRVKDIQKQKALQSKTRNLTNSLLQKNQQIPHPRDLILRKTEVKEKVIAKTSVEKAVKPPQRIPKTIYLSSKEAPESNTLSENDEARLIAYIKEVKTDPSAFVERRTQEIIQRIPKEIKQNLSKNQLENTARIIALDFADKLNNLDPNSLGVAQFNTIEILNSLADPNNPELVKIFPDETTRNQVAQSAQQTALEIEGDSTTSENFFMPVIGPNLANYFYGVGKIRTQQISENPNEDTNYEVNIDELINYWHKTSDIRSKIFTAIQNNDQVVIDQLTKEGFGNIVQQYSWYQPPTTAVRPITGALLPFAAKAGAGMALAQTSLTSRWTAMNIPLLTSGVAGYLPSVAGMAPGISGIAWKGIGLYQPFFGPLLKESFWLGKAVFYSEKGLVEIAGLNLGGFKVALGKFTLGNIFSTQTASTFALKIGEKTVTGPIINKAGSLIYNKLTPKAAVTAAGKTVAASLTKLLVKMFGKQVGGAIANAIPVIGQFVSAVLMLLSLKDLYNLLKTLWIKYKDKILAAGAIPLLFLGILLGSPILLAAGVITGLGYLAIRAGGAKALASGIGGTFQAFMAGITQVALPSIGIPFLATIIALPILVALILFIINSGAYIVPPKIGLTGPGTGDCVDNPAGGTPPSALGIIYSKNGSYAFPVAPGAQTNYACYHWNHKKNVDIFPQSEHQPVTAYTSGVIGYVNFWKDDLSAAGGNYVILNGNDGRRYLYSHNCQVFVTQGQKVKVGDVIATTNTTGNAHGEHVHFGISTIGFDLDGAGNICPQEDFEDKFNLGICTNQSELCI